MRIAALVLTVVAGVVCLFFFALSEGLIRPGLQVRTFMSDDYYAVGQARFCLPYAMLALMGGALSFGRCVAALVLQL